MAYYKVVRPDPQSAAVRSYVPEVARGLKVTSGRFFRNLLGGREVCTLRYPETTEKYPAHFRGRHRLMHRVDGSVRCVACMCCSTACPAQTIEIVAEEVPDKRVEKAPKSFVIDLLRCVYCGNCVQACPCDAIRMDTGVHCPPTYDRDGQIIHKVDLMKPGELSSAVQGGRYATSGSGADRAHEPSASK